MFEKTGVVLHLSTRWKHVDNYGQSTGVIKDFASFIATEEINESQVETSL